MISRDPPEQRVEIETTQGAGVAAHTQVALGEPPVRDPRHEHRCECGGDGPRSEPPQARGFACVDPIGIIGLIGLGERVVDLDAGVGDIVQPSIRVLAQATTKKGAPGVEPKTSQRPPPASLSCSSS